MLVVLKEKFPQDTVRLGAHYNLEGLTPKGLCGLTWFHIPQNGSQVLRPTFPISPGTGGVITKGAWGFDLTQKRKGYEADYGRGGSVKVFSIHIQGLKKRS